MNVLGIKANRKSSLMGEKVMGARRVLGMKNLTKSDNMAMNSSNPSDITQMNSNVIDSQKMPTDIDIKKPSKSKSGLEKGNRTTV